MCRRYLDGLKIPSNICSERADDICWQVGHLFRRNYNMLTHHPAMLERML
jgi:hypothetical protein